MYWNYASLLYVPPQKRQSVMSLYVKAMMAEAPKGSSQEKLRFIGLPTDRLDRRKTACS